MALSGANRGILVDGVVASFLYMFILSYLSCNQVESLYKHQIFKELELRNKTEISTLALLFANYMM